MSSAHDSLKFGDGAAAALCCAQCGLRVQSNKPHVCPKTVSKNAGVDGLALVSGSNPVTDYLTREKK